MSEQQSERERFEAWANEDFYSGLVDIGETWDESRKAYVDFVHHMAFCAFRHFAALSKPSTEQGWRTIESAPRGSGQDGPSQVTHPDYIQPPKILLATSDGIVVGYYEWYYHPGYGRGADPSESIWRDHDGGRLYDVTHWMPLPPPPIEPREEKL